MDDIEGLLIARGALKLVETENLEKVRSKRLKPREG